MLLQELEKAGIKTNTVESIKLQDHKGKLDVEIVGTHRFGSSAYNTLSEFAKKYGSNWAN